MSKKLSVYDMQGKKIEEVDSVFDGRAKPAVISQAVTMYLANERLGLAATKTRGEVSGGGKKPWKQKGTGRARAGSIRSPLWRHGGVVFGPHPRNFHYQLPVKIRNVALLSALNEKSREAAIIVVDAIKINEPKSKEIKKILDNLKVSESAVLIVNAMEKNFLAASRNFPRLRIALAKDVNVLHIIRAKKVIIAKDALKNVEGRLAEHIKK